jgi:hypothetical protein
LRCDGEVPETIEDEFMDLNDTVKLSRKDGTRDSYIKKEQSNARMKLNETIDMSDLGLSKINSMKEFPRMSSP